MNQSTALATTNDITDLFKSIETFSSNGEIQTVINSEKLSIGDIEDMSFFKVTSLTFDKDYPQREAFENVIASLTNPAFNFVYILSGTKTGVELYLGVVKNGRAETQIHAFEYCNHIKKIFLGNFSGSIIENNLSREEIQSRILDVNKQMKRSGTIFGIPSYNEKDDMKEDFQGIDRLINSMQGTKWRIVIVCRPLDKEWINAEKDKIYNIYNQLHMYSKINIQKSSGVTDTVGQSDTSGSEHSKTKGKSENNSWRETTKSRSITEGTSKSHTDDKSVAKNQGMTLSIEYANKKSQEALKYIDEELLERINVGIGKGMFSTSVYYMANDNITKDQLKSAILSLYQGERSSFSPLYARDFQSNEIGNAVISSFREQYIPYSDAETAPALLGCEYNNGSCALSTLLIPKEIGLFAGLPQHEVPGITLKQAVEFGLNVKSSNDDSIDIGVVIQRGQVMNSIPFKLPKKNLNKHIFIGGVTGSGKTVTCQKLLSEAKIPFLVLEPAKTEYRSMVKNGIMKNIIVFTMGNENCAPFRFNPFELIEGENIASHIDMLRATFTSAFPMEASMPQLLDEAIVTCYEMMGWDIGTNTNIYSNTPYGGEFFPTMSELLTVLPQIVAKKGFGDRLQSEYVGSLISRISNLTVGAKGYMLDCRKSVNFEKLIDNNVIIEMEDMKSSEDKALMMGFILSRLACVIRKRHQEDPSFRHITLVEEAHRLLSRCNPGENGAKKSAVEMFTDLLAEVRKYGEGLIIVDQIPNKLSEEVLKNTNTKIIHKLFAKDDKETVGNTMLMDEEQQSFLSSLETGEAVIFTESTAKPMHIKISNQTKRGIISTDSDDISNDDVKECSANIRNDIMPPSIPKEISVRQKRFDDFINNIIKKDGGNSVINENAIEQISALISETSDPEKTFKTLLYIRAVKIGAIISNMNHLQEKYDEIERSYTAFISKDYETLKDIKLLKTKK